MEARSVSVIVVSRKRPQALTRCLLGLSQLDYPLFEVVVVACPDGIKAASETPQADQIKFVPFDEANISTARNAGIAQAAGEIVAFIDDDAVPEPLWLQHLIAPFDQDDVAAAGGYVIGRNGISFQWKARTIDETGECHDHDLDSDAPVVLTPEPGTAIKTEGTNMAVRRDVLARIGGFDPGFRFYLDETDLNVRLAQRGFKTALVPLAQVHHGFAESARRANDRTPRDLTEIGASKMVFLRKHAPEKTWKSAWSGFVKAQRQRLVRLMQRGPLGADDVARLIRGLKRGAKAAKDRPIAELPPLEDTATVPFHQFSGRPDAPRVVLSGRIWNAGKLRRAAREQVQSGAIVSLYLFSPTTRFHRVHFSNAGVWEQRGGLFGRSNRDAPLFRFWRFSRRKAAEVARSKPVRGQ
ncbi:glycosyltransferase family 2 protein [Pacificoceanicola onchidii]|uniref:glycosyltransferase family 2 protein n=1 Tax=Pacificoceanicola onchidii TaxID=2562685 RepID=UPI0010A38AC8|nr:glycosyltransferase [Pacificoceanicola onchidii]